MIPGIESKVFVLFSGLGFGFGNAFFSCIFGVTVGLGTKKFLLFSIHRSSDLRYEALLCICPTLLDRFHGNVIVQRLRPQCGAMCHIRVAVKSMLSGRLGSWQAGERLRRSTFGRAISRVAEPSEGCCFRRETPAKRSFSPRPAE